MLTTIREKITGTFAVIILVVIALSLVVTFGTVDTGFSGATTAATVNGEEISVQEFRSQYQRQRQQWEANFRARIPDDVAASLANNVVQSIVRNRAVSMHAQEQGYRVNDVDVIAAIQGSPVFQVGGRFSRPAYEQLLRSEGLSPQRFEFEQRQSMQVGQYVEGIGYTAFFTPAEFRRYVELDAEGRSVEFALLSADLKRGQVEVSDKEVRDWYETNTFLFQTEETAALEYIELDFAEILEGIDISEAELRAYFDANPGEFGGVEERLTRHILISNDDPVERAELAVSLREKLLSGESFAALAGEVSADRGSAAAGGSLGWLGTGDTPASAFEDALFRLQPGDVSEPVETEFGLHLIRLDGVRDGASPDFDSIAAELRERLQAERAADRFNDLVEELDERALESMDGLASVAEAMSLELQRLEGFSRNNGGLPLAADPALVDTVFSLELLEDGENSSVLSLDDERVAVLRVTAHRLPELKPLEQVEREIRLELTAEKAASLVRDAGSRIVRELNSGAPLSDVLEREDLRLENLATVRRADERLAADFVSAIFQAPLAAERAIYQSQLLANGDFAVFRVLAIEPGRPELFSQEDRDARKEQLAGRLGGGHATAAIEQLLSDAKVKIAPGLIENELGLQ